MINCLRPNHFTLRTLKKCIRFVSSTSFENLPSLDLEYICNPTNSSIIETNLNRRNVKCDFDNIKKLYESYKQQMTDQLASLKELEELRRELIYAALKLPNTAHPSVLSFGPEPKFVKHMGCEKHFQYKPQTFDNLALKLRLIRMKNLSNFTGHRSYYLLDQLAELEQALITYSVEKLSSLGFSLISVPDILHRDVIEGCGMDTRGERTQVYSLNEELHGKDLCLSGTAEMGIGGYLSNRQFHHSELPLRLAAVSRCFRAETSKVSEEKGLYRVHQFTKVEMFGVSTQETSDSLLEEFVKIQEEIFTSFGLHLRLLDMPQEELGAQAYRKYDIEAYLPGKKMWAELSSASNCTDYQSRRLNIKYDGGFVHTVNGTACAVPRTIIAIIETHQTSNDTISVPEILVPYVGNKIIGKSKIPKLHLFKEITDFVEP